MIWRWKSASAPTSFASAVRIAASSVRSSAGRPGHPCGAARKSATDVHRVGRRAAVAEREQLAARRRSTRAAAAAAAASASRFSDSVWPRSAAHLGGLHQHRLAHVRDDRLEVGLAARRGTDRGSSRRRCRARAAPRAPRAARAGRRTRARAPTARGRASRRAPGARTGRGRAARTPIRRRPAEADREAAALPRRRERRPASPPRRTRSRCRRARPAARAGARAARPRAPSPIAGSARLPTITGWTNSTATWRTSERAAGERPSAIRRPPRAKRSAMRWQSRAIRSASAAEEGLGRLAAGARAPPRGRSASRGDLAARVRQRHQPVAERRQRPRRSARTSPCARRPGGRRRGGPGSGRRRSRGAAAGRSC